MPLLGGVRGLRTLDSAVVKFAVKFAVIWT